MEPLIRKVKIENEILEDVQPIDNPGSILDTLYCNAEDISCFKKCENLWCAKYGILISECISFLYQSEHYIYIKMKNCTKRKIEAFCVRMFQDEGPLYENYSYNNNPGPIPDHIYYHYRSGTEVDLCFETEESQKKYIVGWKVVTRSTQHPLTFVDCVFHEAGVKTPYYHATCNFMPVPETELDYVIYERTKKMITTDRQGTSKPEATIFYNIGRLFPDSINRAQIKTNTGVYEADIFIPSLKIAIEYDGLSWHKDKKSFDEEKNKALNTSGIYVIRVRDVGLPELVPFNGVVFYHGKSPVGMHTNEYITCIVHEIAKRVEDADRRHDLLSFEVSYSDIIKQGAAISGILFKEQKTNDVTTLPYFDNWDYEKNIGLDPKTINDTTKSSAWFICHEKKSVLVPTLRLYEQRKCIRENHIPEKYSASAICPFAESNECASYCDYYKQECKKLFFRLLNDPAYKPNQRTVEMMAKIDSAGIFFVKFILSLEKEKQKEIYDYFLTHKHALLALRVYLSSSDELALLERFVKIAPKINVIFNWPDFDTNDNDREKLISFYTAVIPYNTSILLHFFTETKQNPLLPSSELCSGLYSFLTQQGNEGKRIMYANMYLLHLQNLLRQQER